MTDRDGRRVLDIAASMGSPTLEELVEAVSREMGVRFDEAAKTVYLLWKRGRLELLEEEPPRTFLSYAGSLRSLWFWSVTALTAAVVALVLKVSNPPLIYVRYVMGSLFVLYMPGAMLIEALYPRGSDLKPLERLALSIGLSLAVVPLIGLILNYTPWGIRLVPILVSLSVFTEAMAAVALARKYKGYRLWLRGVSA